MRKLKLVEMTNCAFTGIVLIIYVRPVYSPRLFLKCYLKKRVDVFSKTFIIVKTT